MDTYFDPEFNPNPQVEFHIIDMKKADVTGDNVEDTVYLIGTQPSGATGPDFYDNITLSIVDGKTKKTTYLSFKYNAGNNPKMMVADFTNDGLAEIFISIAKGNPGGEYFYYLFSAKDNKLSSLFNFMAFNTFSDYNVIFQDNYKVKITGKNTGEEFIMDISLKCKEYLDSIYDMNGKLKGTFNGSVLPLGYLFPVDLNDDGSLELLAFQRITGPFDTQVIGYLQTFLNFNGTEFKPGLALVSTTGKKTNLEFCPKK